ncbi:MAG: DUF3084 domain-containing protein [Dictyoglomus sp.]|nr:DUF3084 domain-containing protein [Dictyoglomus sp.]MDW8188389.1 DUF3084 domain-containing protein [Dictyoglomus sp.]
MSGFFLILILLILSGVIAYLGDYVGRKVGKKKLTLFNLRPKYTSRLISVFTGILIMLFTLLILSLSSENVRTAIFGLDRLKKQLSSLQVAVSIKNEELNSVIQKLSERTKEKELIREDLEKFRKELEKLELERKRLNDEVSRLNLEKNNLIKDKENLQRALYDISKRVSVLEKEKEKLTEEKRGLVEEIEFLSNTINLIRSEGIVFRRGELILNWVSRGNLSKNEAINEAKTLLHILEQIALNRGAGSSNDKGIVWLPKSEWDKLINSLMTPGEKLIRIIAMVNTFEREPVLVNLQIHPHYLVFRKNEVILTRVVDGSDTKDKIEARLFEILSDVNRIAQLRGVLPDPLTNTVGDVSLEEFYDIVYKIKEKGKKVILSVIATEDTYNSGPLKIRFEL